MTGRTPNGRFAVALLASLLLAVPGAGLATEPSPVATLQMQVADATELGIGAPLSAVLVEVETGQVLVARDEHLRRPIASAIKLVTALVVVESLPPGSAVVVGEEVRGVEGSSYGLRSGEVRSVEDLLAGLLLRSGNDAAATLAVGVAGSEEAFVLRMAEVLLRLGIDASPGSSSGLDPADALTASELAIVARAALSEPRIREIVGAPMLVLDDGARVENRNLFLTDTEGATGLKTGFTSAAGYTLAASAQRDGRELVAVVLGARDDRERRDVAVRLLEHGFTETLRVTLDQSVTLRTGRGAVRLASVPTRLTVRTSSEVTLDWPRTLRPDVPPREVGVLVDGAHAGVTGVALLDARSDVPTSGLGAALADGVYSALRPVGLAGGTEQRLR
jgi:D-alanyl-D-alanine carboxypeptidase